MLLDFRRDRCYQAPCEAFPKSAGCHATVFELFFIGTVQFFVNQQNKTCQAACVDSIKNCPGNFLSADSRKQLPGNNMNWKKQVQIYMEASQEVLNE